MKNKNASALGKLSAKKRKDKKEHIEKMVIARKKKWEEWKLAKNKAVIEEEIKPKIRKYTPELALRLEKMGGVGRTREIVRIRDKYTCADCGSIRTPEIAKAEGKKMFDVHHLNGLCGKKSRSYDKISEVDGLITLCHKCHFNRPEHTLKKVFDDFKPQNQ